MVSAITNLIFYSFYVNTMNPFLLFFRRITFTSCRMTSFLTSSTWASYSCMATASAPFQRMCFVAWSTWTAFSCMTTASGRWTGVPFATSAASPCSSSSTTPLLSCPARLWGTHRISSSSASMLTHGPVAVRHAQCGSGSVRPVSLLLR